MRIKRATVAIVVPFIISFICWLSFPVLFPSLRPLFFAPFLVWVAYRKPLLSTLWYAFSCGLLIDLLSFCLGITSLVYCLTMALLYGQTKNFFTDKLFTLALMTGLFSLLSTSLQALLMGFFGQEFHFSWSWVGSDLGLMALVDATYAFLLFSLPFQLYPNELKRRFLGHAKAPAVEQSQAD